MARMISFVKTPKPNYKIKTQRVSNANGIGQVMSRYGIMTFMSSDTGRISGAFVKPGLKKRDRLLLHGSKVPRTLQARGL